MKRNLIFLIILILSFDACEKSSIKDSALLKTQWVLSSIQNTKTNAINDFPSNNVRSEYIIFTDSANILFIAGTCNGCRAAYLISNDSIKTSGLGSGTT